ncbi:hypothetical protein [Oryzomonas sp.]|uniref:hypothetical protein n=1 Tax=Oryzomonas sp. TaxID=2855186 RepID=UPI0028525EEE|nr:hypothetical protein [Oryzomonas sp.]
MEQREKWYSTTEIAGGCHEGAFTWIIRGMQGNCITAFADHDSQRDKLKYLTCVMQLGMEEGYAGDNRIAIKFDLKRSMLCVIADQSDYLEPVLLPPAGILWNLCSQLMAEP